MSYNMEEEIKKVVDSLKPKENLILELRSHLLNIGFEPTFQQVWDGHDEFHYIKDGVRICYYFIRNNEYLNVSVDILRYNYPFTMISGKFELSELEKVMNCWEQMVKLKNKLYE